MIPTVKVCAVHQLAAGRVGDKGDLAAQAGYAGQAKGRRPVAQVGHGMAELHRLAGIAMRLLVEDHGRLGRQQHGGRYR